MLHASYSYQAMGLFNASQHADAMRRVRELAAAYPNADTTLACRVVEVSAVHSLSCVFIDLSGHRTLGVYAYSAGK
jgi:hypothetical protein